MGGLNGNEQSQEKEPALAGSNSSMGAAMRDSSSERECSATSSVSLPSIVKSGSGASADPSNAEVAAVIAFNFFSSTGIVSANKLVFNAGFTYATTLTFVHFVSTFVGLLLLARMGMYVPKRLDIRKASKLALAGMGFVVFSNLSLQYNSVGFYQVMKHMTVVGVVIIEALLFRKFLAREFWGAISCVCIGVVITGATDFKLNLVGTIYAILNILCTSFYQIWCGSLQKSLDANPLQLQLYIAPLSALFIIPVVPLFDNWFPGSPDSIFNVVITQSLLRNIILTGVLALCVNISIFLLIGKTSAVTYNIAGNGKTAFLLTADFLFFGRPFLVSNIIGLGTTLFGVIWYTRLKLKEREESKKIQLQDESLKSQASRIAQDQRATKLDC
jgi:solute carrier family 35, member E3